MGKIRKSIALILTILILTIFSQEMMKSQEIEIVAIIAQISKKIGGVIESTPQPAPPQEFIKLQDGSFFKLENGDFLLKEL